MFGGDVVQRAAIQDTAKPTLMELVVCKPMMVRWSAPALRDLHLQIIDERGVGANEAIESRRRYWIPPSNESVKIRTYP